MIKKILYITTFFLICFQVSSEINSENIFNSKFLGKENIGIQATSLSEKKQISEIKKEIKSKNNFLSIFNPKIYEKQKNRLPTPRFKGAEEIFEDYADSVVFIGNFKNKGSGTGFVVNHDGKKIITNWHVIEGAQSVRVWLKPENLVDKSFMLNNQKSYNAKVLKVNKKKDLALLDISGLPNAIKPVSFGNFKDIKVGETVFAIGHPSQLIWSFNSGMVSQKRPNYKWKYKNSRHFANVIQTDTAINPGNSGGPLFNKDQELVGVNTFTTEGENLNFAVSVDDLVEFLKEPQKK